MVGKYQLVWDTSKLSTGLASSDYGIDGGIGASSYGLNPFIQRGIIYPSAPLTNKSTNLAKAMIASCEGSGLTNAYGRLFVDNGANFYTADDTGALTKQATGSNTTHYIFGKTDMVPFGGGIFVSQDDDITLWDGASSLTENWGSATAGFVFSGNAYWHPLLIYQGFMWCGEGNTLCSFDGGSGFLQISLLNSNEIISALGIDPFTGLMLIAFQTGSLGNYNDNNSAKFFIGLWDGISAKLIRKIPVDDLVTAFYNVAGTVYVGIGENIGAWNGNGVTFLRKLASASFAAANLPYKHHFSNYNNNLLIVDGLNVLSYGEIFGEGKKVWFPIVYNSINADNIDIVCYLTSGKVGIAMHTATPSYQFYTCDLTSIASNGSSELNLPWTFFPRPIAVHRMRIITTGIPYSGGTDMAIFINTERGTPVPISNTNRILSVPSGLTYYVIDFDFGGGKAQGIQPNLGLTSGSSYGLIQIIIYYDPLE